MSALAAAKARHLARAPGEAASWDELAANAAPCPEVLRWDLAAGANATAPPPASFTTPSSTAAIRQVAL